MSVQPVTRVLGIGITHPDRVVYPELELTKLEVVQYFARVARRMLPHVADRPLAVVRCPDGVEGECFYQKHWPGAVPRTLQSIGIRQSDGALRDYVVLHDAAGIVTLAQWGVVEIHPWGARADDPERPDRLIFDLDPGPGVTWPAVREGARALRALLRRAGLQSWLRTSGGKGVHLLVPIERRLEWEDAATFARAVAERLAADDPARFVARAAKAERDGRIFVDWLRNSRGATAVAPWSPRARAEGGIAMPVTWDSFVKVRAGDQFRLGRPLRHGNAWEGVPTVRQRISADTLRALTSD